MVKSLGLIEHFSVGIKLGRAGLLLGEPAIGGSLDRTGQGALSMSHYPCPISKSYSIVVLFSGMGETGSSSLKV